MAFLTVEDLVGTVEVVVFPRDYEKSQQFLNEDARVFIQGRVSAEDDRASKLILEKIRPFDNMPREIWIQFDNKEAYAQQSQELLCRCFGSCDLSERCKGHKEASSWLSCTNTGLMDELHVRKIWSNQC